MHYFDQSCKESATDLRRRERAEIWCRLVGFVRPKVHNHVTHFAYWVTVMMKTLITDHACRADAHFTNFDERIEVA